MKIMVCGKGGVGKSAISVLMAKALVKKYETYLIDSDESNVFLPKLLGTNPPCSLVEYLGGRKNISKKKEDIIINAFAEVGKGIVLNNLPTDCVSTSSEGIKLITIGKIRNFSEGCACPLNYLIKILLKNLVLNKDEIVLVDTDAGIEHVGRGVEKGCDVIMIIIDPTAEALALAKMLKKTSEKLNKDSWVILNKVTPQVESLIEKKAEKEGIKIDGKVRFDENILFSCLEGKELNAEEAKLDVEEILKNLNLI